MILKNIITSTFLYKAYYRYIKNSLVKQQALREQKLLPIRKIFYKQFVQPGDVVFDVGANIGNRTETFLQIGAKVIAIEPQPDCVKILKKNFGNSIIIEEVGLSKVEGELEMHIANDTTISSFSKDFINSTKQSRFNHSCWETTMKIPVTTMDTLIEKYGIPKFCKIDVEGFELEVLKGLHHPIPYLSFEYCVPEMMQNVLQCIDYLHQLVPTGKFNYSIGETMKLALTEWQSYDDILLKVQSKEFISTLFGDIYFNTIK